MFVLTLVVTGQNRNDNWRKEIQEQVQLLGHRNWILVVDAAYPLQSKPAIKTIATGEEQLDVVKEVLLLLENAEHVFPEVFLDKEIDYVPEKAANGIGNYRAELNKLLQGKEVSKELHEELIALIDESAKTFNILVLKTKMTIPYTSVFLRLNCGYWDGNSEQEMRKKMSEE
jgi:D-ribose pyranose/furanose isomerase RbsD